ncbi:regulator of protease activity HflC (stomatin/prohibitin superfamily) [Streptomyces sp. 3330]|uniref:SPFH domain-containing protein n=1 Tax=Streptomyces sp. 3330 TaxID=2817755 RepID=UPI00285F3AC5|nr:SPFH domain-containing protein [Streptomyces sp. 3330]MDR6979959.1 regulator of protease activity HflC (stomatin/prohibitin superfamily) [Streptomyces sp. 3330]
MADITRRLGWRHLRGAPTAHVRHHRSGKLAHDGPGLSFWFRALSAALSEVPVDDRELAMTFHARTVDFQDVAVQATVTYRISDPAVAAARLDFSIDPDTGVWRSAPLEQLGTLLTETAQQHALDVLARTSLASALVDGVTSVRERVAAGLAAEPRLPATGIEIVAVRVVALRPEPEVERALRTPARELIQQEADRATYERRAVAVERERTIAENELASKIELARREEQLVEQRGTNTRREAEESAAADKVRAEAEATRTVRLAEAEAARSVKLAEAEAAKQVQLADAEAQRTERLTLAEAARAVRLGEAEAARSVQLAHAEAQAAREVGEARAQAQAAWLRVHADVDVATLHALTGTRLAENLPHIDSVTISPDVLTGLLSRLGAGERE